MAKDVKLGDGITFTDNSEEVLSALTSQVSQALEAMGSQAEKYAKGLCPVDTGRLRNSITHTISGAGGMSRVYTNNAGEKYGQTIGSAKGDTSQTVWIGTNTEYAAYVELGVPSKGRKAKPYLKPAVENHASEYKKIAESILKQ